MPFPASLQSLDESILHAAVGTPAALVPVFHAFTVIGAGWGLLALIPFLLRRASREITLWLLAAVVVTSTTVSFIKEIVGRVRPCDALGWCAPVAIASPGGHSFPSGHAAGSFAFAAFVAVRAPRLAPVVLVYAAMVAWSRCVLGVHYPSDVLAGSLLGASIGIALALRAPRAAQPG